MDSIRITETDAYLFAQGTHYEIYDKLGAHLCNIDGKEGVYFAVYAPNALEVYVVGDFNNWQEWNTPLTKLGPGGIWATFVEGVCEYCQYKYFIKGQNGATIYKADPFASFAEKRPGTASKVFNLEGFEWHDEKWLSEREKKNVFKEPLAIYECHVGSFMKHPGREDGAYYSYREFADRIVEYCKDMRYTHVELMGIAEHPFDGSWGYQVTGYYAPTSRYGTPKDFMYLVNALHENGIGVILDWVPAHFAKDAHGLADFDGGAVFEHPDPRLGEHPEWGTKIFNYGKNEIKNFLIANVFYWIRKFHIDGIRVDAVASMLYLDYGKKDGQWVANKYGGNKNLEAIEFFKHLNSIIHKNYPGFMTIAEESTAWPKVTGDVEENGLGFSYKWNMGWMHDFCEYMKLDPIYRRDNHYNMTFAMSYNEYENYILPLSHDEVVHLKCAMVEKMPGYKVDKYANLRIGYTFMFGHSGKKLLFMGQDFGQEREWNEERELDWYMLSNPLNSGLKDYVGKLLNIYREYPCMYTDDNSWKGFEWIKADDKDHSTYVFLRRTEDNPKSLLFVMNFTPMKWEGYKFGVPKKGTYKVILNSDETCFGGNGNPIAASYEAVADLCDYKDYSITVDLPPYTALVFEFA